MEENKRQAEPADDDCRVERIEIEFAIPTYITQEQQHKLNRLLESICRAPVNTPVGGVHWLAGWGSKPIWSQTDARIFGWTTSPDAPESGEPTFDDTVLHGESCVKSKEGDD